MDSEHLFLSHFLDHATPSYGDASRFECRRFASIEKGDVANESFLHTPVHIGTHIDMPLHFYAEGSDIKSFDASFWVFKKPLVVEIEPRGLIIESELTERLERVGYSEDVDILLVKTGMEQHRGEVRYWESSCGFSPEVYGALLKRLPGLRVMGFDTISVSSLKHPQIGREAHRAFLNPERPLLLLEDMHLEAVDETTPLGRVTVAPLRIVGSDGLPCTVVAEIRKGGRA